MEVYQETVKKNREMKSKLLLINEEKFLKIQMNDWIIYLLLKINSHFVQNLWTDDIPVHLLCIHNFYVILANKLSLLSEEKFSKFQIFPNWWSRDKKSQTI